MITRGIQTAKLYFKNKSDYTEFNSSKEIKVSIFYEASFMIVRVYAKPLKEFVFPSDTIDRVILTYTED